jgi:tetratricopeptide (TPR) repeat protein
VKSSLLTVIAIGLPLAAMMALWRYLGTAAPPAPPPPRPVVSGAQPAATGGPRDPSMLKWIRTEPEKPIGRPAGDAAAAEATAPDRRQWEASMGSNREQRLDEARVLLARGRHQQAAQAFDRLLVSRPDDPILLSGKAAALTGLGRHDDALILFENAARLAPDDVSGTYNLAVALMRADQRERAIPLFEQVLARDPHHVKALFNLAVVTQALGRKPRALQLWRQLTDGDPATRAADAPGWSESPAAALTPAMLSDAWYHRGELAIETGEPAEAERCFLNVIEREPRNASAWCNVGIARAGLRRREDALTALNIALQIDSSLVAAWNQTAFVQAANYRDTGDPRHGKAVLECCRRSLRLKPDQPNILALQRAAFSFDPAGDDSTPPRR